MGNNITITASSELMISQTLPESFMIVNFSIHLVFKTWCHPSIIFTKMIKILVSIKFIYWPIP